MCEAINKKRKLLKIVLVKKCLALFSFDECVYYGYSVSMTCLYGDVVS